MDQERIKKISERAKNLVIRGVLTTDQWIEQYNLKFAQLVAEDIFEKVRYYDIDLDDVDRCDSIDFIRQWITRTYIQQYKD